MTATRDETGSTDSTKARVKLSPRTMRELEQASELTNVNKTDTINRAVQTYAFLLSRADSEGLVILTKNGQQEHLYLLPPGATI